MTRSNPKQPKFDVIPARSQEFAKGGGLFWKLEKTVNELDPNFHQSWIKLRRFFCQNQVISKKKGLLQNGNGFSGRN